MKRSVKFLIKGLVIIVLFTAGSITLSSTGVKTVSTANAATTQSVTADQVTKYLISKGYQVLTLNSIKGSEDWQAQTILNNVSYLTHVYVQGGQIVGSQDMPI